MREWRKSHPLTPEQRWKDNCRSAAGVYKRRGYLTQQPCEVCGSLDSQMHHPDYNEPFLVNWLCRPCHLGLHQSGHQKVPVRPPRPRQYAKSLPPLSQHPQR